MADFALVNTAYKTSFGTSPPARACVAVDLPDGVNVRLDCIAHADKSPQERRALHVQSLSYWAPANIGPYSQAVVVCTLTPFLVHVRLMMFRLEITSSFPVKLECIPAPLVCQILQTFLWRQLFLSSMHTELYRQWKTCMDRTVGERKFSVCYAGSLVRLTCPHCKKSMKFSLR